MDNSLKEIFNSNRKNITYKQENYFEVCDAHFKRFVGAECTVLEIGVSKGGSLQMWKAYFGDKAKIYGIDVNPKCKQFEAENINIFIGSQSDRKFLRRIIKELPEIDVLIDDGGHTMEQQIISFEELFPYVKDNGIYLCENVNTSYWEEYGGGINNPTTFIEFSKTLIDILNARHFKDDKIKETPLTRNLHSLHFYDSRLVIEKRINKSLWNKKIDITENEVDKKRESVFKELFSLKLQLLGEEIDKLPDVSNLYNDIKKIKLLLQERYDGSNWPDNGETMIGYKRLTNLERCMIDTIENYIEGDVIETGVWRGGACIFMRSVLKKYGITDKKVWVADSFEGLPKPNPELYPQDKNDKLYTVDKLRITLDDVKNNFKKYDLLDDKVVFLKGWFKDTIPKAQINKLSVLRLDGDMYESTIDVLFYLYPKLSVGGYCIVDDWGAVPACKKAVMDYFNVFNMDEEIIVIDWAGVYWKKSREIETITRSRFNEAISKLYKKN